MSIVNWMLGPKLRICRIRFFWGIATFMIRRRLSNRANGCFCSTGSFTSVCLFHRFTGYQPKGVQSSCEWETTDNTELVKKKKKEKGSVVTFVNSSPLQTLSNYFHLSACPLSNTVQMWCMWSHCRAVIGTYTQWHNDLLLLVMWCTRQVSTLRLESFA